MTTAVRQSVVIQSGGRIELRDPLLPTGAAGP